ncbi:MAG: hypothetical protein II679_07930 [Ruminococcus sp.]|nr:hypothetical protein [Ruminococcus sp.]
MTHAAQFLFAGACLFSLRSGAAEFAAGIDKVAAATSAVPPAGVPVASNGVLFDRRQPLQQKNHFLPLLRAVFQSMTAAFFNKRRLHSPLPVRLASAPVNLGVILHDPCRWDRAVFNCLMTVHAVHLRAFSASSAEKVLCEKPFCTLRQHAPAPLLLRLAARDTYTEYNTLQ